MNTYRRLTDLRFDSASALFWRGYPALLIVLAFSLFGCTVIREHPRTTAVITGIVITGAIAAHQHGHEAAQPLVITPSLPCTPQPNGSCR